MKSKEELYEFFYKLNELRPKDVFDNMDKEGKGMHFVVRYIKEHQNKVYAGEIAKAMKVSTARVAMLTSKLENKGLIKRETLNNDLRKTFFSLTEKGLNICNKRMESYTNFLSYIFENVGENKMNELIAILNLINEKANDYYLIYGHPEDIKENQEC